MFTGSDGHDFDALIALHAATSTEVASDSIPLNQAAADLLLRNLAVASDRLSPTQFERLSQATRDHVRQVATIAEVVAPLSDTDMKRYANEKDGDYTYRTEISQPLVSLQAQLKRRAVDPTNSREINRVRSAIRLSSVAFQGIITDAKVWPEIYQTEEYFWGNAYFAAVFTSDMHPDDAGA